MGGIMRLKNKKTGEIVDFGYLQSDYVAPLVLTTYKNDKPEMCSYNSLAELNEEWEDAPEEPKKYWYINELGTPTGITHTRENIYDKQRKNFGNCFETKEEAEQAVEKLKAWKRLKDKGFRFEGWDENHHNLGIIEFSFDKVEKNVWDFEKDLDLLFSGEDD